MSNIKFANELSLDEISFLELKPMGDKGSKIANIRYNQSSELKLQTPVMATPYGVGNYEGRKYDISVSFRDRESNARVQKFYEFMTQFDEMILKKAQENCQTWFKKKSISLEVLKALYTPSVKVATENGEPTDKYPPTFKMKLPFKHDHVKDQNKLTCPVFNMDTKEPVSADELEKLLTKDFPETEKLITKGTKLVTIVRSTGVWFAAGKFGTGWEIQQMMVKPSDRLVSYAFRDDDDEGDDVSEKENDMDDDVQETAATEYVIDSDNEDL